ncbi:MAG: TlpA family protein disulfide reductase [Acidimicrobiales bacterium]
MTAVVVVEAAALVLLALLVGGLLRSHARMVVALRALELEVRPLGPPGPSPVPPPGRPSRVGAAAPPVSGVDPRGCPLEVPIADRRVLLAFLTSSCRTCRPFWEAFASGTVGEVAPVAIVTPDPSTESRRAVASLAPAGVPVAMASDAWLAYQVTGSPFFVVVVDGVIRAEGPAVTWEELGALLDSPN